MRWLLAAVLLGGCNPAGALWLRIEAPFVVPTQVDALKVSVVRTADQVTVHQSMHGISTPFPHTLSLTTSDDATVGALEVSVTALHGSATVSSASAEVGLRRGELVDVAVRLCDCTQ